MKPVSNRRVAYKSKHGVAEQKLSSSSNFVVVGAYPRGQSPDMCRGQSGERPGVDDNIQATPRPEADPVWGLSGGLMTLWYPQAP